MQRFRKTLFTLTLAVAVFGTPVLAPAHASGAAGGPSHPLLIQAATVPGRIGLRRRRRGAKARVTAWRFCRQVWHRRPTRGGRIDTPQPRLPPQDSLARGPPRSAAFDRP